MSINSITDDLVMKRWLAFPTVDVRTISMKSHVTSLCNCSLHFALFLFYPRSYTVLYKGINFTLFLFSLYDHNVLFIHAITITIRVVCSVSTNRYEPFSLVHASSHRCNGSMNWEVPFNSQEIRLDRQSWCECKASIHQWDESNSF